MNLSTVSDIYDTHILAVVIKILDNKKKKTT